MRCCGRRPPHRSVEALPKGLSAETVALVVRALQEGDPLSAGEAAERVGTSRVTARRYLEHLVDTGVVARRTRHGGSGGVRRSSTAGADARRGVRWSV